MFSRLKLWQKIGLITAVLGIPLLFVTREYVKLAKELSLNNLNEQLQALPAIEHIGNLTRLIQDHGASLPLWVIGSDITPTHRKESADRIDGLIDEVSDDLAKLQHFDRTQWEEIVKSIKALQNLVPDSPRRFAAYAELSGRLTNYADILSYNSKFYSGAGNLFIPSRLAVDLTPSLGENINMLRGFISYKVLVNEKSLLDLSTASSYLNLAESRFQEISQSMVDLTRHNPEFYQQLKPSLITIEHQLASVRGMVKQYLGESEGVTKPEIYFVQCSELISSIYGLHNITIHLIELKLRSEIRSADSRLNSIIGLASFAGVLVLALVFLISRSFVRGIRDIAIISEQVAGGNRQIRFPPQDSNIEIRTIMGEIGRIYLAICASEEKSRIDNQELEEKSSELAAQNKKLEVVIDNLAFANKDAETKGREAAVANRHKSIFLANMSHELRTPLNSIMILAQVLAENREKTMSLNQIKNANIIHNSGKDLLKLINDILDLSRIEAGKIEVNSIRVELAAVADETREMYEALAKNKRLRYTVNLAADCPESIETDPMRLSQIVRNFVANAIKFTEAGQVTVTFLKAKSPAFELEIKVSDTGVGIPDDKLVQIFEPFQQLDNTLSRKQEGTGLGLAISRNLAQKLGGDIEVSSELGKGSSFSILLPKVLPLNDDNSVDFKREEGEFKKNSKAKLKELVQVPRPQMMLAEDQFDGKNILIVDDDIRNVYSLRQILHGRACSIFVATNGFEALEILEGKDRSQPKIDLVLMDIMMPEMDGYEAMRRIRAIPSFQSLPIIALTAKAMRDDRDQCLAAGANDYLLKPVDTEKLILLMRVWLGT